MSVVLLNAILAPFLALVAVPLLIHLFARSKPPVYRFSSVEFILRIIRSTMRVKRPQDWLLLAIRTLLYSAVILLFLQPLFFAKRRLASPFQKKNVVLVVDATASMAYTEGAQTRFAAACAEASEILSGLSSRDTANIVWLDSSPDSVFPSMGVNMRYLQGALRRARVTSEAGDVREAVGLACRMLEGAEGVREVCVISDFQATAWQDVAELDVPSSIELIHVKVGAATAENVAITGLSCNPTRPLVGEEVTVSCDVFNFSPQPKRAAVFLNAGESRQSQDMMVPSWEKVTAIFRHVFTRAGDFPVTVSLGEDSFAGDDVRRTIAGVREHLRVGLLEGEPETARVWRRALDALGWARTESISPRDLAGELPFDAILLSGWDGSSPGNLRAKLTQGRTVVCFPARDVSSAAVSALAGGAGTEHSAPMRWEGLPDGRGVKMESEDDEVFELFADGEYGDPSRGTFKSRLAVPRSAVPGGAVLMAYDDGVPALVKHKTRGSLFLWNMPLDGSGWASQVEFLPFLAELLLVSRTDDAGAGRAEFMPGELVSWRLDREILLSDVRLVDGTGSVLPVREDRGGATASFVARDSLGPGLYRWSFRGKQVGCSVVNFPVVESDLRAMSMKEVEKHCAVAVAGGSLVRRLRDGTKLWPYLLAAAFVLVLCEGLALVWVERT
jgi:hypothetical protein